MSAATTPETKAQIIARMGITEARRIAFYMQSTRAELLALAARQPSVSR